MKRKMYAVVLCIGMLFAMLTGCGEYASGEKSNSSLFKENFSTSKEAYLKDIKAVMEMSAYLEHRGDDFNEVIEIINKISVFTKEGNTVKASVSKFMELTKEGLELTNTNNMTVDNLEERLEQALKLKQELDELLVKITEEQVEDLLLAAKNAGVEAKDLQELGFDF